MGSSTRNKGQNGKTPLVPSWLDDNGGGDFKPDSPGNSQDQDGDDSTPNSTQNPQNSDSNKKQPDKNTTQPTQPDPRRFSVARSNFTRYINSGGNSGGNLRRAVSSYVRHAAGGSQNATKRLGAARISTTKLLSVIGGFASGGVSATARLLQLGDIIGKSAKDAFLRIMDFVCPDGGRTDEGIARNAYIEALLEMQTGKAGRLKRSRLLNFLLSRNYIWLM
jgi:hypothetical protein